MVYYANTAPRYAAMKFFKGLILSASLVSILACSPNDTEVTASKSQATNITDTSTQTPLLKSITALYPGGKVPQDQSEAAAVMRMQNANNGTSIASSFGSSALTSELVGSTKNQVAESINAQSAASSPILPQAGAIYGVVSRVQNTSLYGAYFFTIYPIERSAALTNNPNWNYEGPAFTASLVSDVDLYPVHRFRNLQNGSYLYTIYETERSEIAANRASTFFYEGIAWYARQTPAAGWKPLYRFRNVTNGTYLFSAYENEKNTILANYPTVFELEGVAYYVKEPDVVDKYVGSWTSCSPSYITQFPYITTNLIYSKVSSASLSLAAKVLAGYSDSGCKIKTYENLGPATTGTVTFAGTKLASLKTVDKMHTVLSTGSILGDIYYTEGNRLYTGGGSTDASGYFNLLATEAYLLQ